MKWASRVLSAVVSSAALLLALPGAQAQQDGLLPCETLAGGSDVLAEIAVDIWRRADLCDFAEPVELETYLERYGEDRTIPEIPADGDALQQWAAYRRRAAVYLDVVDDRVLSLAGEARCGVSGDGAICELIRSIHARSSDLRQALASQEFGLAGVCQYDLDIGSNPLQPIYLGRLVRGCSVTRNPPVNLCEVFSGSPEFCRAPDADFELRCDSACRGRAAYLVRLIPVAGLLESAATAASAEVSQDAQAEIAQLATNWDAYYFDGGEARIQMPWELLLNGAIYSRSAEYDPASLNAPPSSAWVLLHPAAGVELYDQDGVKAELAIVVELLGFSNWRYDDASGRRTGEYGGSLIAAYNPNQDNEWGYGVLLRTPWDGWNVSVIQREMASGDEVSMMFSKDISSLVPRIPDVACRLFDVPRLCAGD